MSLTPYVIVRVAGGAGDPDEGNDFTFFSMVADKNSPFMLCFGTLYSEGCLGVGTHVSVNVSNYPNQHLWYIEKKG